MKYENSDITKKLIAADNAFGRMMEDALSLKECLRQCHLSQTDTLDTAKDLLEEKDEEIRKLKSELSRAYVELRKQRKAVTAIYDGKVWEMAEDARNRLPMWEEEDQLSDKEMELMRHAVGFDSDTPFYRNYFATTPGSEDATAWGFLVVRGYAELLQIPDNLYTYRAYALTQKGIEELKK